MDPLSITASSLALAKTAFQLAIAIHSGIEAVKGVDNTLQTFHGEVTALANALNLVSQAFQDPKLRELDGESLRSNGRLSLVLESLRGILSDCEETLSRLDSIVQNASEGNQKSIFRRSTTALKLNFKSADIMLVRQQTQTYISAMQMTLSMLNISIVLAQSQPLSNQDTIAADVRALESSEEALRAKIQDSRLSTSDGTSREKVSKLKQYLEISQSVLSSASTVYGSEAGSTFGDYNFADMTLDSPMAPDSGKYSAIDAWRRDGTTDHQESSLTASISAKRLALALKKLDEERYLDAEKLLKTCISSPGLQEYQINEARLALALCHEGQEKFPEAVRILLELLDSKEISHAQMAHLNHRLAEVYLRELKAEEALPYALYACNGRHNRQQDDLYYDSCRLTANIYRSLGDPVEASIYYEEIPPQYRYRAKATGKLLRTLHFGRMSLSDMSFSPDGDLLASSHGIPINTDRYEYKGAVFLWRVADGGDKKLLGEHPKPIRSICFTPNGCKLISACTEETKVWNMHQGAYQMEKALKEINLHVASPPDNHTLVLGSTHGRILWRDLEGNDPPTSCGRYELDLNSMSLSQDGRMLATGSSDCKVRLYRFPTGTLLQTLVHNYIISSVSFSPDGFTLASATYSNTLWLWDVGTGRVKRKLEGHTAAVWCVSFSPDGHLLASSSEDNTIKLWDVASGKLLQTLVGHTDSVEKVSFSPDGFLLASGSDDTTIRLWRIEYS